MTAIFNQQSAEFGPEQDPHFVDYLAQPFMLGEHTPAADAKDIADQPHDLSADEKLARLKRMIPLMRAPFEDEAEAPLIVSDDMRLKALKLEFTDPANSTSPPQKSGKPKYKRSEIFKDPQ